MDFDELYKVEVDAGKLAAEEVEKNRLKKDRFLVNHKPDEKEMVGRRKNDGV